MNPIPRGRLALWLAFGGMLLTFFSLPWLAVSFGLFAAALVSGIRAKREAKAAEKPEIAVGATAALIIGGIGVTFGMFALVSLLLFRTEVARYEECALGANTEVAKSDCLNQLMSDSQARLDQLMSGIQARFNR